jgi:hypothetical protein
MNAISKAQLATISITSLTSANLPDSSASACLVRFPKKTLLLTVAHATTVGQRWAIPCRYVPEKKGVDQFIFGPICTLGTLSLGKLKRGQLDPIPIDFAYAVVPNDLCIMQQEIDVTGAILSEKPKISLPAEFVDPKKDDTYCFYGLANGELNEKKQFVRQERKRSGMSFLKTDSMHHFRCGGGFRVADHLGCRGAPILNGSGQLVSLVVKGRDDKQQVSGVYLRSVWAGLMHEAGEFGS